ncbi:cobalt-precorrin-5B (C(1))-methyltransferase [Desulfogranum mediterraneum]|uniref:cobalt-precorrin-5B (C(1))-methyltransferase n=1 Tax=Desulfogranum mediterraneum TaxID=160661 RepID=UPI000423E00B|nr:cobalt-precorrin-5B (C(1))-methyltransferase [Desulfogranum mediterraneum]
MTSRKRQKKLRSGYSTGACAAAAAKAAVLCLLSRRAPEEVTITFPDDSRHRFELCRCTSLDQGALATVVKDAGDDPDVTNGAEIGVEVRLVSGQAGTAEQFQLLSGSGVGTVTKPGLPIPVGEPAINPMPRKMIRRAMAEGLEACGQAELQLAATVFIPGGEELAKKTLNQRLGILGGLSVLGTTGIVRPVSAKAWTDTIEASMSVARAAGLDTVLLSTGRTSERAVQEQIRLPEEAQVMMGDYLRYALEAAQRHGFSRIVIAAMWAKLLKAALAIPQTHVRNGALEPLQGAELLEELGLDPDTARSMAQANTAREIYDRLLAGQRQDLIHAVSLRAQEQARHWSGLAVAIYLVTSEQGVVHHVPD